MSEIIEQPTKEAEYIAPPAAQLGTIHISNDVVSKIVGMAAQTTPGVSSMSVGLTEGLAKSISGKSLQKGIDVSIENDEASIQLRINVHYGLNMQEVCQNLQHNVQQAVEQLAGVIVKEVRVQVVGVAMPENV
ncbi:MAG: Asp23/Gls24 family envelope stress response protein [Paenibacillus sp.]|uniref:Asp23/Gls24 family envelope stress response protein n=1 Tax=Paenibacillus sp. TaxID=58172 RepID=UPI0025E39521|nr:Asp23/Gls24 family envelope stress response protein [Paenibacillus sp.]MBR2563121.1 Asp23/Gls24 family envelope stress response protein [Paenibacillus sp.]